MGQVNCINNMGIALFEYYFGVIVTLTSDFISRIIVSGAYLLYYLR